MLKDKYDVIYAPKGKAKEYADLALNIYGGCPNRCTYCFAPDILRVDKEQFHSQCEPRKNVLARVEKDLAAMAAAGDTRRVNLCFVCDPYPGISAENRLTRDVLEAFDAHGMPFSILTKSASMAMRDFDLYRVHGEHPDTFGVTLTFMDITDSMQWEPNATLAITRLRALERAKRFDIPTWVSFEPVVIPEQTFQLYDRSREFVDEYKVGKLNYMPTPVPVDWRRFTMEMINRLERDGKRYYIKESLREYMDGGAKT